MYSIRWLMFPFVVLYCAAIFVLCVSPLDFGTLITIEWRVLSAKLFTRRELAQEGIMVARERVHIRYGHKIERLADEGQARVAALANDPVGLAGWLARLPEP